MLGMPGLADWQTYRDFKGDCQGRWLGEVWSRVVGVDGRVRSVIQQRLCVEAAGQLPLNCVGVEHCQVQAVVAHHIAVVVCDVLIHRPCTSAEPIVGDGKAP